MAIPASNNLLTDMMQTALAVVDGGLIVQMMNASAEQLFAMSQGKALGEPLDALLVNASEIKSHCLVVLETGVSRTLWDIEIIPRNHPQVQRVDCMLTDGGKRDVMLEFKNIDSIAQMIRQGWLDDRQSANRAVIRGMAHEIKNPLGGIRGAAQLLDQELDDLSQREYTSLIIRETDRLVALVTRMHATTKMLELAPINIHEVLERVRVLLEIEYTSALEILQDYDPSLPLIHADRDSLIQAIMNIAINAVQAIDEKGQIQFRTRFDHSILRDSKSYQQVVRVEICDQGPGIPKSIEDRIFDPMVTGREKGTGLGLSIAADIVRQCEGRIDVESSGAGTCFKIFLPVENNS